MGRLQEFLHRWQSVCSKKFIKYGVRWGASTQGASSVPGHSTFHKSDRYVSVCSGTTGPTAIAPVLLASTATGATVWKVSSDHESETPKQKGGEQEGYVQHFGTLLHWGTFIASLDTIDT